MNQQEALVKLATVRLAINHVLRTRAMQKSAGFWASLMRGFSDVGSDLESNPDRVNGVTFPGTRRYVEGLGGTLSADGTRARYSNPQNASTSGVWPLDSDLKKQQEKVKRLQKQLPPEKAKEYEKYKEPHHNATPSAIPSVAPAQPNVIPLPAGTLQPGGLFPFR